MQKSLSELGRQTGKASVFSEGRLGQGREEELVSRRDIIVMVWGRLERTCEWRRQKAGRRGHRPIPEVKACQEDVRVE